MFRMGGEEFIVLLHDTDSAGAAVIAEGIRHATEALTTIPGHRITVSIGIAELQSGEDWEGWMKRADLHLYRAKYEGRNRIAA